jgi:predicted ATPase
LRDLAVPGGSLQRACSERGGVPKIRSLMARKPAGFAIDVTLVNDTVTWNYRLNIKQKTTLPDRYPIVDEEIVRRNGEIILNRPNENDKNDSRLLSQTALEQISANGKFRDIVDHFSSITYLHIVPQVIRNPAGSYIDYNFPDIYGGRFLEKVAGTQDRIRKTRLKRIEEALRYAVPQFEELELTKDDRGVPHLEVKYRHWRPNAARQNENQLSDGTLRLIGLLWALQDGSGLLLMEEPELSLHNGIVRKLAQFIYRIQSSKNDQRQIFISTHSTELLADEGISSDELIVFHPDEKATRIVKGDKDDAIRTLMDNGLPASEAALPQTETPEMTNFETFTL